MAEITIIGSGNMARAIGTRALAAGRSLQILSRSPEHAASLAAELGGGTTSGGLGDIPDGDIVVLAPYFGPAKEVATHYGDTLSGKTVVEISNPANADTFDSLTVEPGSFAAAAGLRPLRVGALRHARELEGFQLLVMALQANPAYETFNWATGLKIVD